MKRLTALTVTLLLSVASCSGPIATTPQAFCVQYANTSADPVSFQAVDATGTVIAGSQLTMDPPQSLSDPFASELINLMGVPPITFSAPQDLGAQSCTVVTLSNNVIRVEALQGPTLECAEDQGTCN